MKNTSVEQLGGFTLIELLVVVLIIGILASVVLPQYQVAVKKARYANLVSVLGAFRDAEEVYFLANGSYVDDTDALDVGELSGCASDGKGGGILCKDFTIDVNAGYANNNPAGFMNDGLNAYVHYQDHSAVKPGVRECWAKKDDQIANQLCRSMGGTESGSKSGIGNIIGGEVTIYTLQ